MVPTIQLLRGSRVPPGRDGSRPGRGPLVLAAIPPTTLRKDQAERACAEEECEHRRRRLVDRGAVAVRRRARGSAGLRRCASPSRRRGRRGPGDGGQRRSRPRRRCRCRAAARGRRGRRAGIGILLHGSSGGRLRREVDRHVVEGDDRARTDGGEGIAQNGARFTGVEHAVVVRIIQETKDTAREVVEDVERNGKQTRVTADRFTEERLTATVRHACEYPPSRTARLGYGLGSKNRLCGGEKPRA